MEHYFQSEPVFDQRPALIDRNSGTISNVVLARVGEAKGHGAQIDRKFLLQVVDQANSFSQGVKSRFGHPNMCSNSLGSYLGRFRNFSYRSDNIVADLFLDETAKKAPAGNLFDYVMDMAERNPDMFGASLAFISDKFETLEVENNGVKESISFFRLKELRACDIVDDPAATDGLFSAFSFAAQGTALLDENPTLTEFIFHHPDKVIEFLHSYLNNNAMKFTDSIKSKFLKLFSSTPSPVPQPDQPDQPDKPHKPHKPHNPDKPHNPAPPLPLEPSQPLESLNNPLPPEPSQQPSTIPEPLFHALSALLPSGSPVILSYKNNQLFSGNSDVPLSLSQISDLIISFSSELKSQLTELQELAQLQKDFITEYRQTIETLENKLAATPTLPVNVTDPLIKVDDPHAPPPDTTGKNILNDIPKDLRYKLKNPSTK